MIMGRSLMNDDNKETQMTSFEIWQDNVSDLVDIFDAKPREELPVWMQRESDYEPSKTLSNDSKALDFD